MAIDILTSQTIAQVPRDLALFRKNVSARDGLLAHIGSGNSEGHRKLEERLSALETAHQSMQQAHKDINAARKEAARQKIAQIKAKIQALQMMIGDSVESRARKVAQLARELAQAVRAYKAAGGQGGVASASAGTVSSVSATAATGGGEETASLETSVLVAAALPSTASAAERRAVLQADKDFAEEVRGIVRQLKNMRRGDRDDEGANHFLGQALRSLTGLGTYSAAFPAAFSVDVTV